jgi:hypothetical protein
MRGELTGIALSSTAIGEGVNADNIRTCIQFLRETTERRRVDECSGTAENIRRSVAFLATAGVTAAPQPQCRALQPRYACL